MNTMSVGRFQGQRVAIYARFSSSLQREASIDDQVRRCRDFIVANGGVVDPNLIFSDAAVSGSSLVRPAFERMIALVDRKPAGVDAIVAEDLSRITRDFADAANIFQRLRYLQIPLIGIADGVDTSSRNAKLTFTVKSLVADLYIDELRDRTLRGLEGRALAGYSTGGLPLGYRSAPVLDAFDRVIGHRIEIDPEGAAIVRRVFDEYLAGRSLEAIARLFNEENVPPPRARTRHRRKGWVASTVREMVRNESYVGIWRYKQQQWVKVPGTNTRRPRKRDAAEVIVREYPERRIIPAEIWSATKKRIAEVRACYVPSDRAKHAVSSGKQNNYVLSGLLKCGRCGAPMTIHAGTSARYYRCSDAKKRGTCSNRLALREDVAKRRLLDALGERFRSPASLTYLRKKLAQRLGEISREATGELAERKARLARTEERIGGLVTFITQGDQSEYVRKALVDLEAQAKTEKAAIAELLAQATKPIELPSADAVIAKSFDLERIIEKDPLRGREALKRLFAGGVIAVHPQPEGHYLAESQLFPLALVLGSAADQSCGPAMVARGGIEPPTFGL